MNDLVFAIDIVAPLQRVWDEITTHGPIQAWMFNCRLEGRLEPGGEHIWVTPDRKRAMVAGTVIEADPPHRLVHTFFFTTLEESPTVVTWELRQLGDRVRVTVTHRGFTDQAKTRKGVEGSWGAILADLKRSVETGRLGLATRLKFGLMGALAFLLPRATLVDRVRAKVRDQSLPLKE